MAESMSEAEIVKKYYLSKLTSKKQRHKTEHAVPAKRVEVNRYCDSAMRTPVVNSSVSKQIYKVPEKQAYKIYRYNNTFFNADRHKQPLPRSSYNREYLVNPPSHNQRYKPKDTNVLGRTASDKFINSSYQADFNRKTVDNTNYKELDAYQNKIK